MGDPGLSFSVIIPAFNRAHVINRSIHSVLNQTYSNLEVVIVDDGSTDKIREIIESIPDSRLQYHYQEHRGRSAARNSGARISRGQYLTFLDSDDEVLPEWLEHLGKKLENPKIGVVCCGYVEIMESEDKKETIVLPKNRGPMYCDQSCLFQAGTFAIRREIFMANAGYSEKLAFAENTELAMRLVPYCVNQGWEIATVDKPAVRYYRNTSKFPVTEKDYRTILEAAEFILERHDQRLREIFPRGYANYCAVAGVNAARLGNFTAARKYFSHALVHYPYRMSNYWRWFLTFLPSVGRRFWLGRRTKGML